MKSLLLLALLVALQMPAAPVAPPKPKPEIGRLFLGGDIYSSLEEMLARELPKRVAPADRWEVKIARDGNDLPAGKFRHVEIKGVNVRAPDGLLVSEATLTLDNLKVDMASGSVQVLGDCLFQGKLTEMALEQALRGRTVKGWKELRVAFQEAKLALSGVAVLGKRKLFGREVLIPGIPVTVTGVAVPRGVSIDFKADRLAVEQLPVPPLVVRELERHVNPVVDLTGLKVVSQITRVAVDGEYLVTEARLDFSKGLPLGPKKKPASGANAAVPAPAAR